MLFRRRIRRQSHSSRIFRGFQNKGKADGCRRNMQYIRRLFHRIRRRYNLSSLHCRFSYKRDVMPVVSAYRW